MKRLITFILLAGLPVYAQYSGGSVVAEKAARIAADANLQGQVTTNAADFQSLETNVYTISEADAALALKVDITDGKQIGTVKLEETGVSTNYLSKVYIGGQLVITEVYNGTTNTYYDFTD